MIARVFPRRTRATPVDDCAFVGDPDLFTPEFDEVRVSVAFEWDIPEAERLSRAWATRGRVTVGGPAMGTRGEAFTPGEYLRRGYVITSRGCPNRCWFCSVPKREGGIRTLPVTEGFDVLDDNLLACPMEHVESVFSMLQRQRERCRFSGGLDASLFGDRHVELLMGLRLRPEIFLAYDTPNDEEPLREAMRRLNRAEYQTGKHLIRVYVLIGYPGDTLGAAEGRLRLVVGLGATPMAMLFRAGAVVSDEWRRFQRLWVRPGIIYAKTL